MTQHDASGLKHWGIGLGWAWLGDRSEPEADRVITVGHMMRHNTWCVCDETSVVSLGLGGAQGRVWD